MTDQLSLLDQFRKDEVALAEQIEREAHACRHGRQPGERCPFCDPYKPTRETRSMAHISVQPQVKSYRERVYDCIRDHGPIHDEGIAFETGLGANTARPRRIELEKAGRIAASGTQVTRSGRKAVTWVVTTP